MRTYDLQSAYHTFDKPISANDVVKLAMDITQARFIREGPLLYSSDAAQEYISLKMSAYDREVLACVFLDQGHRVIAYEELFWGTINKNTIYLREIAKRAFFHTAAAIVIAHNHPSGSTEPSPEDIKLTKCIKESMGLIEISLIDHLIVGGIDCVSLADRGMI